MSRTGPRRPVVPVRLAVEDIAFLDGEAVRLEVSRSDVIRAALAAWAARPKDRRKV